MNIDNGKRYAAQARYLTDTNWHDVVSTTNHPSSSYGQQVWMDANGESYGQITLISPLVEVRSVREITVNEAEAFEDA